MNRHPHSELVDALGGPSKIAAHLNRLYPEVNFSRQRVHKWRINGVAWQWRPEISRMAKRLKINLPDKFMEHDRHG